MLHPIEEASRTLINASDRWAELARDDTKSAADVTEAKKAFDDARKNLGTAIDDTVKVNSAIGQPVKA